MMMQGDMGEDLGMQRQGEKLIGEAEGRERQRVEDVKG